MSRTTAFVVAFIVSLAAPASHAATLTTIDGAPVEGSTVTLVFEADGKPAAGVVVKATYRQNAHAVLITEQAVGTSGSDGRVAWSPERAGVVALSWDEGAGSKNVSVRYAGTPASGLLVTLLAGTLLLGGAAFYFKKMLSQPPEDTGHPRVDT